MMQVVSTRKRLSSAADHGEQENLRAVKSCASSDLVADCQRFLEAHGMAQLVQSSMGPLGGPFWWALAELNVTLAAFQHLFHEQKLLESRSFTRSSKALAFEKLAFAHGCKDIYTLQAMPGLQAVSLVLETALLGCQEAAISAITLRCPPFLEAWATRWMPSSSGSGTPARVRITIVQGYREGGGPLRAATCYNLGLPTCCGAPAQCTIYVPYL